jgi:hypothetical protein
MKNDLINLIKEYNNNKEKYSSEYLQRLEIEIEDLHSQLSVSNNLYFKPMNFLKIAYFDILTYRKGKVIRLYNTKIFDALYKIYSTFNNITYDEYIKKQSNLFLTRHQTRHLKYAIKNIKNIDKSIDKNILFYEYLTKHLFINENEAQNIINTKAGRKHRSLIRKSNISYFSKKAFTSTEIKKLYNKFQKKDTLTLLYYKKNPYLQKAIDNASLHSIIYS